MEAITGWASHNGALYAVSDDALYVVNVKTGESRPVDKLPTRYLHSRYMKHITFLNRRGAWHSK